MSMQNYSGDAEDLITEINVTPFVDVVLVLLILFMLAAPAVYQSAVQVQLPTLKTANKVKHVTLHFFVTAAGEIFLEKEKLLLGASSGNTVEAVVKRALTLDSKADAMISADRNVSHGNVMEAIEAIKKSGMTEVALGVEVKEKG